MSDERANRNSAPPQALVTEMGHLGGSRDRALRIASAAAPSACYSALRTPLSALLGRRQAALAPLLLALAACVPGQASRAVSGERLVLAREDGLWAVPLDGRPAGRLTSAERGGYDGDPALSPDGKQLVFSRTPPYTLKPGQPFTPAALPQTSLFVAATDGSRPRRLANHPLQAYGAALEHAVWHPDGKALYVTSTTLSFAGNAVSEQRTEIGRVEAADGSLKPVVQQAAFPAVAPDGRRLAYVRGEPAGGTGLYVADLSPDGTRVANERAVLPPGRFEGLMWPRFSPDGRLLAFSASLPASPAPGALPVLPPGVVVPPRPTATPTLGPRGEAPTGGRVGGLRALVTAALTPLLPETAGAHGLPMDIFVVDLDGSGLRRVTQLSEDEPAAAWSPDGARLAILGAGGLYVVPATGGDARTLDRRGGRGGLAWAPR